MNWLAYRYTFGRFKEIQTFRKSVHFWGGGKKKTLKMAVWVLCLLFSACRKCAWNL